MEAEAMALKYEDWEDIGMSTFRLRTPMGWLVRTDYEVIHDKSDYGVGMVGGWDWRPALAFVFDPLHRWQIKAE